MKHWIDNNLAVYNLLINYLNKKRKVEAAVWWPIVANLNTNHRRNFKSHSHYDITLKFKTEIKYETDFYYHFYFAFYNK